MNGNSQTLSHHPGYTAQGVAVTARGHTPVNVAQYALLKKLIWAYYILLIFEGALRKWILPELATPLLIIRDPLAFLIVVMTWRRSLLPATPYLFGMVIIGITGMVTATLFGHGNLWVALFGARILLLHYPLIFAIGRIFTREDVVKVGRITLWLAIPMALLIVLQFYSPQSAWVNRGVGGSIEGGGFSGAMGFFRPSTTFSFTTGTTLFFGLAAPFTIFFWLNRKSMNRVILVLATIAVLIAIPFSISRSLFFGVGVSLVFSLLAISRKPKYLGYLIPAALGTVLLLMTLNQTTFFQKATEVFIARFEIASESEGGLEGVLLDRYLGGLLSAVKDAGKFPFFGYGLGLGTNVGSMLTKGEVVYLIAEDEWARLIGELGPFMGLLVILLRIGLSVRIAFGAYAKLVKGDLLPWMLLSFGLLILPQGQWGQPTSLGFSALIGGLMLASLRVSVVDLGKKIQEKDRNEVKI